MSKPWTEKLTPSQVTFMNSFIEQVPEQYGARQAVIDCLQNLANDDSNPKYRFIICMNGDVVGSNDEDEARNCAVDEEGYVLDIQNNVWFVSQDPADDTDIMEAK